MELKLNAVSICQLLKSSLTRRGGSLPSVYLPHTLRLLTVDRLAVPTLQTFFPGQLTYQRVKQSALIRNTRGPLAAPRCKTLFRRVYFGGRSSRCSLDIKGGKKSPLSRNKLRQDVYIPLEGRRTFPASYFPSVPVSQGELYDQAASVGFKYTPGQAKGHTPSFQRVTLVSFLNYHERSI